MAQIFSASADAKLRLFAGAVALAILMAGALWWSAASSSYRTGVDWVSEQPVPFSHQHHAGELGIDCRYCHDTVETSARAGLPSTETCMTCHSQIWTDAEMLAPVRESLATGEPLQWNRVARVPDYVYFDHSIHVTTGVPCETCHGRVDTMPLMKQAKPFDMGWCLDCHRDPAPKLRPPSEVTRMDWSSLDDDLAAHRDYGALVVEARGIEPDRLDDCNVCHR
ncbi:cytochrome c3 family protein [Martelella mediterranea]|uniref:Class III cytochrome C family protein n=1 Tax=Martelella mediterranea DSM 17316 TaxID=1122214 RepID=A0A1U9Z7M2_9HYPH|nr:cytochrome c3 family protein [Martelella mediterranea]AQZ53723.1 Class III cytochrome C family protein [Martelella mediterranea DSM 17316]